MPKQLAKLNEEFADIQKRVGPMLQKMQMLDNNFWNATSGNWGRYYVGLDLLSHRLNQLGVATATDPAAAADPTVQKLLQAIASDKADCREISSDYWMTVTRVEAIAREVTALKGKVDGVVREKSGALKKSNSLADLQALSNHLNTFKNDLDTACSVGPHRPNHALLV